MDSRPFALRRGSSSPRTPTFLHHTGMASPGGNAGTIASSSSSSAMRDRDRDRDGGGSPTWSSFLSPSLFTAGRQSTSDLRSTSREGSPGSTHGGGTHGEKEREMNVFEQSFGHDGPHGSAHTSHSSLPSVPTHLPGHLRAGGGSTVTPGRESKLRNVSSTGEDAFEDELRDAVPSELDSTRPKRPAMTEPVDSFSSEQSVAARSDATSAATKMTSPESSLPPSPKLSATTTLLTHRNSKLAVPIDALGQLAAAASESAAGSPVAMQPTMQLDLADISLTLPMRRRSSNDSPMPMFRNSVLDSSSGTGFRTPDYLNGSHTPRLDGGNGGGGGSGTMTPTYKSFSLGFIVDEPDKVLSPPLPDGQYGPVPGTVENLAPLPTVVTATATAATTTTTTSSNSASAAGLKRRGRKPKAAIAVNGSGSDSTLVNDTKAEQQDYTRAKGTVDTSKLSALERNRIAASKSRKRKRERMQAMEQTAAELSSANAALQSQAVSLRAELLELRAHLSALHPDAARCKCTHVQGYLKREQQGQGIPLLDKLSASVLDRQYANVGKWGRGGGADVGVDGDEDVDEFEDEEGDSGSAAPLASTGRATRGMSRRASKRRRGPAAFAAAAAAESDELDESDIDMLD